MKEKLTKAKFVEWQASLFGACFIAFGLGVILSNFFGRFSLIIIFVGVVLHGWGMYKMYKRNKEN